jgi:bifunctional DNA-binding transcriptional regulator/antitoxin component of YhaV-PrlF toxin-antitoxin module
MSVSLVELQPRGQIVKADHRGRLQVPAWLRKTTGIRPGSSFEVLITSDGCLIYRPRQGEIN